MRKPLRSVDNRDLHEVERSDKARIEALQRRIADLEVENRRLNSAVKGAAVFGRLEKMLGASDFMMHRVI